MDHATRPAPAPALLLSPEPEPVLRGPFTPAGAAAAGVGRAELERLVREGRVRRLLRGVYLEAGRPCPPELRAAAAGLVLGARQVVVGRTAAWLHGTAADALLAEDITAPLPLEVHARTRTSGSRRFCAGEVVEIAGIRCTSLLRTAIDLGCRPGEEIAQAALDGMLRGTALGHRALILAAQGCAGRPGAAQLRELAARADGRADGAAESVLRMRWLAARLPTPATGVVVAGRRLALGLPTHRFGAVLTDRLDEAGRALLAARGWRVLALEARRVLGSQDRHLIGHLEREFHQHLLIQAGAVRADP